MVGTLARLPAESRRKAGMTSSPHGPYARGRTRATMGRTKRTPGREAEPIAKNGPQFGLQAATRLHEAGIASNRGSARRGEFVPEPCTHRPSSHQRGEHPKSPTPSRAGAEGETPDGD